MSASYLLDDDPGEANGPAHLNVQEGSEHDAEAPILPSHKPECYFFNRSLLHSKPIKDAPSEHVSASFPPVAQFVPVNPPSFADLWIPRTFFLPCKPETHGASQALASVSGIRSLILATGESIVMPSNKRKRTTNPTVALGRRERATENKKEHSITVAKDPVTQRAQFKNAAEELERDSSVPQTTRSAAVLGELSEKTLNKLQSFKFVPQGDGGALLIKNSHHKPDNQMTSGQDLAYLQQDATTAGDDYDFDDFDEFDLDENIFKNIFTDDDAEHQTPDSTSLATHDSSDVSSPTKTKSPPGTRVEGPSQPYPAALFKSPLKLVEAPLLPLSPFLRSNLPQPVPTQANIPSLVPHRRIPTLFRIAEVYRLLAMFSPTLAPQRIELYATVASSHRGYHTQTQEFTFADLFFPHRPPYLRGTYSNWHLCELFDEDSTPFLDVAEQNKLCRAIVQTSNKSQNRNSRSRGSSSLDGPRRNQEVEHEIDALEVDILNIWEATWEDIEYVKGIVMA